MVLCCRTLVCPVLQELHLYYTHVSSEITCRVFICGYGCPESAPRRHSRRSHTVQTSRGEMRVTSLPLGAPALFVDASTCRSWRTVKSSSLLILFAPAHTHTKQRHSYFEMDASRETQQGGGGGDAGRVKREGLDGGDKRAANATGAGKEIGGASGVVSLVPTSPVAMRGGTGVPTGPAAMRDSRGARGGGDNSYRGGLGYGGRVARGSSAWQRGASMSPAQGTKRGTEALGSLQEEVQLRRQNLEADMYKEALDVDKRLRLKIENRELILQ